ncbi:hypothetical protein [Piscinibacter defluvii]|uniref:hypothetical protein n=1 Tax=Piscinibacter defluvii TaxID=1796922 RepID=UPI000FDD745F|nr:hypothetical protein [Piscinibacter defluvii]
MLRKMFLVLGLSGALACPAISIARPSIMFAAGWDPEAVRLVREKFGEVDYLSSEVTDESRPGPAQVFALPASLESVRRQAGAPCNLKGGPTLVIYDPEHWEATPESDRRDLPATIEAGADAVRASGCRKFGLAPDGQFIGLEPKECRAAPSALARSVNWKKVDVLVLQAQRLLSDKCGGRANIAEYSRFVAEWSRLVKAANPAIKVFPSMTFRYTDVATMSEAIRRTRRDVDGYYLAYPSSKSGINCDHCRSTNLKSVVDTIGTTQ